MAPKSREVCGALLRILLIYAVIGLVIAAIIAFGMRRR
jgi:hypothetical protein